MRLLSRTGEPVRSPKITSGTFGNTCSFRHVETDEKHCKKSKKGGAKGSVGSLKESTQFGLCVSRFLSEKVLFHVKKENLGIKSHAPGIKKKSGKKGSIARNYPNVCAS